MNTIDRINRLNAHFELRRFDYKFKPGQLHKAIDCIDRKVSLGYTSKPAGYPPYKSINHVGHRLNRLEATTALAIHRRGPRRYYFHLGAGG